MSTFIVLVILIVILIGVIGKLVKKTREVRASFRETFGGGADQTRENATNMVIDNSKDKVVPQWAIADAARELTKYNLADSQMDAENQLTRNLLDLNYTILDIPKDMMIGKNLSKEQAERGIKNLLQKLNAKYYKDKGQLSSKDEKYVDNCRASYFFAVESSSIQEAAAAVNYMVDEWKVDVEDGKI